MVSVLSLDPSRTSGLRRAYMRDFSRRVGNILQEVRNLILVEDAFGLTEDSSVFNTRWKWNSNAQKAKAFRQWLDEQIKKEIVTTEEVNQLWTKRYLSSAYLQGRVRGTSEAAKVRRLQLEQFTQETAAVFRKQEELLARSLEDLKGFSSRMASDASRSILDSLSRGDSASTLAKKLSGKLGIERRRAMTIARTEIVHAQAEGQLDAYEDFGVDEVEALVEWTTAGDSKVCSQCLPLEGVVLSIQEARGLIPRHPNCRCAWEPVDTIRRGMTSTSRGIRSAVRKSSKSGSETDWAKGKRFKSK